MNTNTIILTIPLCLLLMTAINSTAQLEMPKSYVILEHKAIADSDAASDIAVARLKLSSTVVATIAAIM